VPLSSAHDLRLTNALLYRLSYTSVLNCKKKKIKKEKQAKPQKTPQSQTKTKGILSNLAQSLEKTLKLWYNNYISTHTKLNTNYYNLFSDKCQEWGDKN
ncbi:MAG: hypothetical protein K2N36_01565, partial [Ruminiclostridium sp.]|nr:hypothetical protein [Ruminiclostridium sp.]